MTRVEKDGRGPRGKSFTVKIPRVFQDDRLNAVLNEPRVFFSACLARANDPFEVNAPWARTAIY